MLEKVDLQKTVDKETYRQVSEELGERLGLLQRRCKAEKIPVIIVFEGLGAAGKGVQINRLIQPLDPRGLTYMPAGGRRGRADASFPVALLDENAGGRPYSYI